MKKLTVVLLYSCFSWGGMQSLQAVIPFTHMFHLGETFRGFKACHPLLGWTALHRNVIHNLRFNGNFKYQKGNHIADEPLDGISNLVKMLFPSPSGTLSSFTVHRENIGNLIKSRTRNHPGVVAMMMRVVKAKKDIWESKDEEKSYKEKKLKEVEEALSASWRGKNDKFETKIPDGEEARPRKILKELSLFKSVDECLRGNHFSYPPYLVEQILMAFLCDRFDTREDILSFSRVLNKKIKTSRAEILNEEQNDSKECTVSNNERSKNFILTEKKRIFKGVKVEEDVLKEHPPLETYMDATYGNFFFDSLLPYDYNEGSLRYDNVGCYNFDGKKEEDKSFSSCVESSFLQFLNILLFDPETKNFEKHLKNLGSKITFKERSVLQKLYWFYLGEQTGFENLNKDKRLPQNTRESVAQGYQNDRFAKVIGDLNNPLNPHRMSHVYYSMPHGDGNKNNRFELDVGPFNMLATFENLLGVPLGEGGIKIDEVREQAKLLKKIGEPSTEPLDAQIKTEKNNKEFFESHIKSGFKNLFKFFERDGFKIKLSNIVAGNYTGNVQDYMGTELYFDGEILHSKFSFCMGVTWGHQKLWNINVQRDKTVEKESIGSEIEPDRSLLKEVPYHILDYWQKESPVDFYDFYTVSFNNQEELFGILKKASNNTKECNEKYLSILEKVIKSIRWNNNEMVEKGWDSLFSLIKIHGNNHLLFSGIKNLDMAGSCVTSVEGKDFPSSLEELDLSYTGALSSLFIKDLTNLKKLNLCNSALTILKEGNLPTSLEELSLVDAKYLDYIQIKNLTNLKKLNLAGAGIKTLKQEDLPTSLEELDLQFTRFRQIYIKNLTNLKKLDLYFSKVTDIYFIDFPENLKDIITKNTQDMENKVKVHVPLCFEEQRSFLKSKGLDVITLNY